MTVQWLELISVLACTLFTGAAFYITAVEHPARLSCGTDIAAAEWAPSYKRATIMQVPPALAAGGCGIARGVLGEEPLWIWGAALILSVIPFTLIVIRPTNNRLLDQRRDRGSNETHELLHAWGRLHGVRTVLSLAASVLYTWAAIH
jgi:hypothetical protein